MMSLPLFTLAVVVSFIGLTVQAQTNAIAVFKIQPIGGNQGRPFTQSPVIAIVNSANRAVLTTVPVTARAVKLMLPPNYFTTTQPVLSGNLTASSTSGEVTLVNLVSSLQASRVTLTVDVNATVDGVLRSWTIVSEAFNIGPPESTTTQQAPVTSATPAPTIPNLQLIDNIRSAPLCVSFPTQPYVIWNYTGTPVNVTATLVPPASMPGAYLTGTRSVQSSTGTASFTDLKVCNGTGLGFSLSYTIRMGTTTITERGPAFTVSGTLPTTTTTAAPVDLSAAKLRIVVQPAGGTVGLPLKVQPVIRLYNQFSNIVPANGVATASLYLTSRLTSSGAALTGTLTANMINGEATFSNIGVSVQGNGYILMITLVVQGVTMTSYSTAFLVSKAGASFLEGPDGGIVDTSNNNDAGASTPGGSASASSSAALAASVSIGVVVGVAAAAAGAIIAFKAIRRNAARRAAVSSSPVADGVQVVVGEPMPTATPRNPCPPTAYQPCSTTPSKSTKSDGVDDAAPF